MIASWMKLRPSLRLAASLVVFLASTALLFVVFSALGGIKLFDIAGQIFPVGEPSQNTNTTAFKSFAQAWALPSICLLGGVLAGYLTWNPHVSSTKEAVIAMVSFLFLASISGVNFWAHDALINIKAQVLLDYLSVFVGIILLALLWKWKTTRPTAIALRSTSVFIVSLFGIALPGLYGTGYMLTKLGITTSIPTDIKSWTDLFSALIAAGTTAMSIRSAKN